MYSAKLGRFLQVDPLGYWDDANLYKYCSNNPLNWIDLFGLQDTYRYLPYPPGCVPPSQPEPLLPKIGKKIIESHRDYHRAIRRAARDIPGPIRVIIGPPLVVGGAGVIGFGRAAAAAGAVTGGGSLIAVPIGFVVGFIGTEIMATGLDIMFPGEDCLNE